MTGKQTSAEGAPQKGISALGCVGAASAAGQALGRVLLTTTARRAAASPLGQAIDLASTRELLGDVVGGMGHVQMLIRVGYADDDVTPFEPTPWRAVADVLTED